MGEAKRRGTPEERRAAALKRERSTLLETRGDADEATLDNLRAGIAPFMAQITEQEWFRRRAAILERLRDLPKGDLATAPSIRVADDEIAWYLFLCEQALTNPMCIDVSQAARAIPFFCGIGDRWKYAARVKGLEIHFKEILSRRRKEPDGLLFEVLTALAYAENGWDVEFVPENPPNKTPDLVVSRATERLWIECKRQSRFSDYSIAERNASLRLWDRVKDALVANGQWIWLRATFHVEPATLPDDYLAKIIKSALPIARETCLCDSQQATVWARLIDQERVRSHLKDHYVKANSPSVSALLGHDWAPLNSQTTFVHAVKYVQVEDCDSPLLGMYIDEIRWACGVTREVDAELSVDRKARDVKSLLADAVKQVPDNEPSVIHIAVETLDGTEVERRRTEKVMQSIPLLLAKKPIQAVRLHRLNSNQTTDRLFLFDETVEKFNAPGASVESLPPVAVIPARAELRAGAHWELYK